ncbi:hypothetical protein THTE_4159 [Thermogutta terrifontis]|uniref:Uncharacterized protein n=1 Tax=Thermogutta terrifontis TaxID=1331910 RepID=A0A286RLC5_9BACT|nr:hypothetical protein THTE_4159 [Thermogutta terrifontis]
MGPRDFQARSFFFSTSGDELLKLAGAMAPAHIPGRGIYEPRRRCR